MHHTSNITSISQTTASCAPTPLKQAPLLLAGDPRQLGPVLRSATAAATGLSVSLLDSWIHFWHTSCPQLASAAATAAATTSAVAGGTAAKMQPQLQTHGQQGGDGMAQSVIFLCYGMLTDNYRSHRRLLDLPSRLFYSGALRACAPAAAVAPPAWSELMGIPLAPGAAAATAGDDGGGNVGEAEATGRGPVAAAAAPGWGGAGVPGMAGDGHSNAVAAAGGSVGDDVLEGLCPSSTLFVGVNGQQRQVRWHVARPGGALKRFKLLR